MRRKGKRLPVGSLFAKMYQLREMGMDFRRGSAGEAGVFLHYLNIYNIQSDCPAGKQGGEGRIKKFTGKKKKNWDLDIATPAGIL